MSASEPIPIHPMAAIFPMMSDDELVDRAADIKANGMLHPIVLDAHGLLVDGRNRLRACELAGIAPDYESLNGEDTRAFIVSANRARRNLSKGQQAMAMAIMYPEPESGGRGKNVEARKAVETAGFSNSLLKQARAILRHSVDLASQVMAGTRHFDEALQTARTAEQAGKSTGAQKAELQTKAPDVAALVSDGRLTLEAGMQELRERQKQVRQLIDAAKAAAGRFVGLANHLSIVQGGLALTDAHLALLPIDRDDADPLADVPLKEILATEEAVKELKQAKIKRARKAA
jgi:hypothetical protein